MALNTNKTLASNEYYCLINEVQYGPYDVSSLISKIDRNTLVWREGIDWIKASEVMELRKFFLEPIIKTIEKDKSNSSNVDQNTDVIVNKNMFSSPFSFDGRIRRTEYGISFIIYFFSYALIAVIAKSSSILFIAFIPLLWFLWAQGAKRCHDRGNSGWHQIIPFYVFWMLFA